MLSRCGGGGVVRVHRHSAVTTMRQRPNNRWCPGLYSIVRPFPTAISIRRAIDGCDGALEALLADLWPIAFSASRWYGNDITVAEDAAQQACLKVALSIRKLKNAESFQAWFLVILLRVLQRESSRLARWRRAAPTNTPVATDPVGSEVLMRLAIAKLPSDLRQALLLTKAFGYSSEQAAYVLKIPAGTVRYHVCLAKNLLYDSLYADCGERIRERDCSVTFSRKGAV